MNENRLIVFSCGYNCEKYVEFNISSIKNQNYNNYVHIIVDDASSDTTYKKLKKNQHKNMIIYRNKNNQKWIPNAIQYLTGQIKSDNDIILTVDLDDWLAHDNVFKNINNHYNNFNSWITYSNFKYLKSNRSSDWIPNYTSDICFNRLFRENIWSFKHLRTFKSFLWKKLDKNDLKDKNGNYFKCTYDMAVFMPMLEMSSNNHIGSFNDIQYIYNDNNPNNVDKTNLKNEQKCNDLYIRSKNKYSPL